MSRAQGDGYRTWTDEKLNAYRRRLDEKLKSLRDHKEKWYDSDGFRIHTESENILENPRGDWKWDGWRVTGRRYWIRVYEEGFSDVIIIHYGKNVNMTLAKNESL